MAQLRTEAFSVSAEFLRHQIILEAIPTTIASRHWRDLAVECSLPQCSKDIDPITLCVLRFSLIGKESDSPLIAPGDELPPAYRTVRKALDYRYWTVNRRRFPERSPSATSGRSSCHTCACSGSS